MAAAFTPHWVEHPLHGPEGPKAWIIFVVTQIGGRHRPLAVLHCGQPYMSPSDGLQGRHIIFLCLRIIAIFSDSTNRVAIQSEIAIAADFYQDSDNLHLAPIELLEEPRPILPLEWTTPEFPFVSTCLLLGVGYWGSSGNSKPGPLGTVYRDNKLNHNYGMIVIDITDLDFIRYGIIGFMVRTMVWDEGHEWDLEGPVGDEEPTLENDRPRTPLSASEYINKFEYDTCQEVSELDRLPLIDASAMDFVWPPDNSNFSTAVPMPAEQTPRSLSDQAFSTLIDATLETESFEMVIFDKAKTIPHFQELLQRLLQERSEHLGKSRSAGQLLALAFEGKTHLDLVRLRGLSAQAIRASLETPELKDVRSISLCVDTLLSSPAEIVAAISRTPPIRDLYFLQSPNRRKDHMCTQLFLELSKRPDLLCGKLIITGAHAAALTKKSWLPPTINYQPPVEIFPIQHIFCRLWSWKMHYYVGDGLLRPERFAAGLLTWLSSMDTFLFSFAAAAPGLEDMSRVEISAIPAENFSIPHRNRLHPGYNNSEYPRPAEFWPQVRDLVPKSWTVLVLNDDFKSRRRLSQHTRLAPGGPNGAWFVKYAFVRPHVCISVGDPLAIANLSPEELEVRGLKEFLKVTAPGVDPAIVDQRLEEVVDRLVALNKGWPAPLGTGIELLSVLNSNEACDMLKDLLSTALQGKQRELVHRQKAQGGSKFLFDFR
ncbi:hypothetical protein N431DRAFT_508367 [Stipitochalara longipes BDJ]|nr:hypothetical protein N431DRAFT_508367 [Stipitochalara longipes BDJ]